MRQRFCSHTRLGFAAKSSGAMMKAATLATVALSTPVRATLTEVRLSNGIVLQVDIPEGAKTVTINGADQLDAGKVIDSTGRARAYSPGGLFDRPFLTQTTSGTGDPALTRFPDIYVAIAAMTFRCSSNSTFYTEAQTNKVVLNAPTQTVVTRTSSKTTLQAALIGGPLLYDQTFAAAYTDAWVQAALPQARLALTTAGGPGVVIAASAGS